MPSNFLVLLGGPGKFVGCDKAHDQTWTNYLVPIQLAGIHDLFKKAPGETVHLLVYQPAYKNRWDDDSVITKAEQKQSDGYWLHSNRKSKADSVLSKGAKNYLQRIEQIAASQKMKFKQLTKPSEFWSYISSLPDGSVSRVWYSGHAAATELMLSLDHDPSCQPVSQTGDMIFVDDIKLNKALAPKFSSKRNQVSKFIGCYTHEFAKVWNQMFKVKSEGAVRKVDFGVVDRASSIKNVIERIEKAPTTHGPTGWTQFHTI